MERRRAGHGSAGLLVLLLVVAAAAGTWNYRRNVAAEEREYRPYAGYSDADIDRLIEAYEQQAETASERYRAVADRRAAVRDPGHLAGQVREFERTQQVTRRKKELQGALADQQASLKALRAEKGRRSREWLPLFWRRVLTI